MSRAPDADRSVSAPEAFDVECPRCGRHALVRVAGDLVSMTCVHCGASRSEEARSSTWGGGTDPWLGLPLWLRDTLRGHEIWAWNLEHLAWLREWVAADLRERTPNHNRSLASRLPRWMKDAHHRDDVLRALDRMAARR